MKTIRFFAIAAVAAVLAVSCGQSSEYDRLRAEAEKEVADLCPTKSAADSISYLLGVNYGMMFQQQGFADGMSGINMAELEKGIKDAFKAGTPKNPYGVDSTFMKAFKINPYDMNKIINGFLQARANYKNEVNAAVEKAFLSQNALKETVDTTASGLQYTIISEGAAEKISPKDTVWVNYKGQLLDGRVFDENDSTKFVANQVIKGWTEGLGLIGEGGKATLYIPSELGYGKRAPRGSMIEPNSTLVFDVEVLKVGKFIEEEVAE